MSNWRKVSNEQPDNKTIVFVGIAQNGSAGYKSDQVGVVLFKDGKFGNGSWTHWMYPPRIPKQKKQA